ncbi:MAG: hypothetical protein U0527_12885 [Candidatus Eisenbacteria bacterium]
MHRSYVVGMRNGSALALLLGAALLIGSEVRADEPAAVVGKNSKVELSGVGWAVYRYRLEDADTTNVARDYNSFDLDRVYFSAAYAVDERMKWVTTLEANNKAGVLDLFLKKAYLQVKDPFHWAGSTLWLGQFDHQFVVPQEKIWGLRSVSKVGLDDYFGVASTHVGAGVGSTVANGQLDWALTIGNERPYNKESTHKYKTGLARVTVTPAAAGAAQHFHLLAGLQVNADKPKASDNQNTLIMLFPHWQSDDLMIGLEFDRMQDKHVVGGTGGTPIKKLTTDSQLLGVMASARVTERLRLFGRVESYDPNTDGKKDALTRAIAGVARSYGKNVRGIVDLDLRSTERSGDDSDMTLSARAEVTL